MRRLQATVTERGRVTIPAAVRGHLGVGPGDKVVFEIDEEGSVHIAPLRYTVETAYGAVSPIDREDDLKDVSRDARQERAERAIGEMRSED